MSNVEAVQVRWYEDGQRVVKQAMGISTKEDGLAYARGYADAAGYIVEWRIYRDGPASEGWEIVRPSVMELPPFNTPFMRVEVVKFPDTSTPAEPENSKSSYVEKVSEGFKRVGQEIKKSNEEVAKIRAELNERVAVEREKNGFVGGKFVGFNEYTQKMLNNNPKLVKMVEEMTATSKPGAGWTRVGEAEPSEIFKGDKK